MDCVNEFCDLWGPSSGVMSVRDADDRLLKMTLWEYTGVHDGDLREFSCLN